MTTLVLRILGALALMGAAACAGVATSTPPTGGPDYPIRMESLSVPLGIGGATLAPGVTYAGGLSLRGPHVRSLSDMKIHDGRVWAVSDFGDLVRFSLRLSADGRLIGTGEAVSRHLTGPDGTVLAPKESADAEGLAILPNGEVLVSFERNDRIWTYGVGAVDRPRPVPSPVHPFPRNEGMEGLAASDDGWLVLGEGGGAWLCDPTRCRPLADPMPMPTDDYRFTGADRDPAGGWFVVERYYREPLDLRARVRHLSPEGVLSAPLIQLRPPASTDNFEGIAAVATPTGTRLYILSDNNDLFLQKTLLLAFDIAD